MKSHDEPKNKYLHAEFIGRVVMNYEDAIIVYPHIKDEQGYTRTDGSKFTTFLEALICRTPEGAEIKIYMEPTVSEVDRAVAWRFFRDYDQSQKIAYRFLPGDPHTPIMHWVKNSDL